MKKEQFNHVKRGKKFIPINKHDKIHDLNIHDLKQMQVAVAYYYVDRIEFDCRGN